MSVTNNQGSSLNPFWKYNQESYYINSFNKHLQNLAKQISN